MHRVQQPRDDIIDVSRWEGDEDFPILTIGSKPKRVVLCPQDAPQPYLRPGHRYMFKEAVGWQAHQTWSEILAYELAREIAAPVPPCFVAIDAASGAPGVLMEFFYGYPDQPGSTRLVHAADLMQGVLTDTKRGRPHGIHDNIALCRTVKVEDPVRWWARTLAFDALIGNTDRHPENWGFLYTWRQGMPRTVALTPLYDNGTSLGYEIPEQRLLQMLAKDRMAAYVAKGKHHCAWSAAEDSQAQHAALCKRLLQTYGSTQDVMTAVAAVTDAHATAVVEWATGFDVPVRFSAARADFVAGQLSARRAALQSVIGV